ncbi:Atp15 [Kluyveromyces lactis]|nr:Atp15 [Kluyveromyces lactis]
MSTWRKAGLTFNNYVSVAANTVRAALKPELQTNSVLARSKSEAKFIKFENGVASEPVPLKK